MKILSVIGSIAVIIILAVILAFAMLIGSFLFIPWLMYIIPLIIALYVFLVYLLTFKVFGWFRYVSGKKAFYGGTAVIAVVGLSFAMSDWYKQSLDRVGDAEADLPILDGATALYPMYAAFAQAVYPENAYPLYDSEVMSNMTHVAYENLINGEVDLIFVAGPSEDQVAAAKRAGKELKLAPIGKEAFVFFVNSKNKVEDLTMDEIRGIYSGELTNWKEVGGKNKAIRAFQRPQDSGSQTALQKLMGDVPIMDPPVDNVIDLMGGIIDQVSAYTNYNNAIGFTFRFYSTEMVQNDKIRLLAVNGVEPTKETIRSGDYPITSEFYAVTAGSDNPHIDAFIEWVLSEQGQEIVEKTGYVSIQ